MSVSPVDAAAREEMTCDRCGRYHGVVWFAPSEVWNAVMRGGVRGNPDEFSFCCPICFMQLADLRSVTTTGWRVAPEEEHDALVSLLAVREKDAARAWEAAKVTATNLDEANEMLAVREAELERKTAALVYVQVWGHVVQWDVERGEPTAQHASSCPGCIARAALAAVPDGPVSETTDLGLGTRARREMGMWAPDLGEPIGDGPVSEEKP